MAQTSPQANRSGNGPIKNIRDLIEVFERSGELVRVKRPVDKDKELAAVLKRVQTDLKKAVLFESVKGTDFMVVGNLYGGRDKLAKEFWGPGPGRVKGRAR